jgi:DNA-binding NtrC family response regulator
MTSKLILIIDDDPALRKLLSRILQDRSEFEVHEAADGNEGLEMIRDLSYDLVVTDIFMPGEDGIGTIMDICESHPETKIIAMSGGGNVKDVDFLELASCLGANKVFQKPFDNELFLSAVDEMVH